MRCVALRPPETDLQVESALNLEQILLVGVGCATDHVARRNASSQIAGVRNQVTTPTCGRLHSSHHVGACIASAALR